MTIIIREQDGGWLVIFKVGGVESVYGAPNKDDIPDLIQWRVDQWMRLGE